MSDHDYYMSCGCWSGQSDHTCRIGGGWRRPDCRCGAPDDCYCHESCSSDSPEESCASHREEYAADRENDHEEAIAENDRRNRDARTRAEDDAVRALTAGRAPRVVRVQAYDIRGNVHVLTNGMTHTDIRPRDCTNGDTRRAAVALARMVLLAVPDVESVQMWDAASGMNVWGMGNGRNLDVADRVHTGRPWFVVFDSDANGIDVVDAAREVLS